MRTAIVSLIMVAGLWAVASPVSAGHDSIQYCPATEATEDAFLCAWEDYVWMGSEIVTECDSVPNVKNCEKLYREVTTLGGWLTTCGLGGCDTVGHFTTCVGADFYCVYYCFWNLETGRACLRGIFCGAV